MREFQVQSRILASEIFFSQQHGFHRCLVRTRDESYIGGGAQIIDFSKDGGKTWIRVANFFPNFSHQALIAYDGVDTYVIMCGTLATFDGMFRSTNDGASFVRVTSITGFDWGSETMKSCQYGTGSKLWGVVTSSADGEILSSSDDGSSWSEERNVDFDDDWVQAHSSTGVMFFERLNAQPEMIFDADGVSLGAPVVNPLGVSTGARLFAGSQNALFADPNSDFPARFFVTLEDASNSTIVMFRSDDDGATWSEWITPGGASLPIASASEMNFGWDGEHYHVILDAVTASQDLWLRSRDGIQWMPAPLSMDSLPANQDRRIAFQDKPA